jgi:hypothetical protein
MPVRKPAARGVFGRFFDRACAWRLREKLNKTGLAATVSAQVDAIRIGMEQLDKSRKLLLQTHDTISVRAAALRHT